MNAITGMEKYFGWLLQATWEASVIVGLILLAQYLLRNRLPPVWRYRLWLLLVVRLLLPVTLSSPVSVFNFVKWPGSQTVAAVAAAEPIQPVEPMIAPIAPAATEEPTEPAGVPQIRPATAPVAIAATSLPAPPKLTQPAASPKPVNWMRLAMWAWIVGTLVILARFVSVDLRFRRRLSAFAPVTDQSLTETVKQCAESLGLKRQPLIIETDEVDSPAVYGVRHHRLLLPEGLREQLSDEELRHVLLHELAHIKRRDPELNWLLSLLQIVHWFNPLLWLGFARMRADRELATDQLALARTHKPERLAYGETIIKLLDGLGQGPAVPALIGIAESKAQIKERIEAIAQDDRRTRWRWVACATSIVIVGLMLTSACDDRSKESNVRVPNKPRVSQSTRQMMPETVKSPDRDPACASVVAVAPANGETEVEPQQELRIRFDRPMNPDFFELEWTAGGGQLTGPIQVKEDGKEFIIPVRMTAGQEQKIALNRDRFGGQADKGKKAPRFRQGFVDANGEAANEFKWSFSTKLAGSKTSASKPKLVSISPASESTTPLLVNLEVKFDQPMRSPQQGLPYVSQQKSVFDGPSLIPFVKYDQTSHQFSVPALLRPNDDCRLTIEGFYSADGVECDPIVVHYRTDKETLDPSYLEQAKASASNPELQKVLTAMKEARAQLTSGIERVQSVLLMQSKNAYNRIHSRTATFKWQGTDQFYADITGPMSMTRAFILGTDGQSCWLSSQDQDGKKRLDRIPTAKAECRAIILDPFDLSKNSVDQILAKAELIYTGKRDLNGRPCYVLENWDITTKNFVYATLTQWWIDEQTALPTQIVQYHPNSSNIYRFEFQNLNQPLPKSAFQPPPELAKGAEQLFFKEEPKPGERRFWTISDGSNGRMSGRMGWRGSKGTTSSGLN